MTVLPPQRAEEHVLCARGGKRGHLQHMDQDWTSCDMEAQETQSRSSQSVQINHQDESVYKSDGLQKKPF